MEILQTNNSTKLTMHDVQNICDDYKNGLSRNNIQKKYHIGGNRIAKILSANSVTKNSKYIIERNNDNNIDQVLTAQIENMKKNMESIKFKSFI